MGSMSWWADVAKYSEQEQEYKISAHKLKDEYLKTEGEYLHTLHSHLVKEKESWNGIAALSEKELAPLKNSLQLLEQEIIHKKDSEKYTTWINKIRNTINEENKLQPTKQNKITWTPTIWSKEQNKIELKKTIPKTKKAANGTDIYQWNTSQKTERKRSSETQKQEDFQKQLSTYPIEFQNLPEASDISLNDERAIIICYPSSRCWYCKKNVDLILRMRSEGKIPQDVNIYRKATTSSLNMIDSPTLTAEFQGLEHKIKLENHASGVNHYIAFPYTMFVSKNTWNWLVQWKMDKLGLASEISIL